MGRKVGREVGREEGRSKTQNKSQQGQDKGERFVSSLDQHLQQSRVLYQQAGR